MNWLVDKDFLFQTLTIRDTTLCVKHTMSVWWCDFS